MIKLFHAEIVLYRTAYMDAANRRLQETVYRLVWAADADQAESIVRAEYTREDPYGRSVYVDSVLAQETLGTPPMLRDSDDGRS